MYMPLLGHVFLEEGDGVVFRLSAVHHQRLANLNSLHYLLGEHTPLHVWR